MLHNPSARKSLRLHFSRQELALIAITIVWGGTFLAVQHAMTVSGPMAFVGFRFAVAALALALFSLPVLKGLTWREFFAGTAIGSMIFIGYALQTVGLQTISSSKSAFITAMYVPLVPLLQWAVFRRPPRLMSWLGVSFAFAGLILLAGPEAGQVGFELGEILTLIGALGIAAEIILIGLFAGSVDSRRITIVQLATAAVISFAMMPAVGEAMPSFSWTLVLLAGGLGLASAIIQLIMNWAQKSVSPTRATVIYAGEPVWAGIVGRIAGERLPVLALAGGALIVIGVIVSELQPKRRPLPEESGGQS
ncbi:DMT family transporter [Limoniibacter endophyticus]|uniref:Membrane protein n=1 Tax=Limoniibacter endophyticus TaxID=1565040 RepID=A0A8J3DKH5_9HYPH|nr:DMT family transporter [Limoniibacter endophyticus]GHC77753.1 membrane protein [Limoniibacter endophyticus]